MKQELASTLLLFLLAPRRGLLTQEGEEREPRALQHQRPGATSQAPTCRGGWEPPSRRCPGWERASSQAAALTDPQTPLPPSQAAPTGLPPPAPPNKPQHSRATGSIFNFFFLFFRLKDDFRFTLRQF